MTDQRSTRGFEFQSLGIAGLLKGYRLRVPPYQREYSWGEEEVGQLYEDLSNAKLENKDYFLGTIVTINASDSAPLEIVDGQQRLTTTAILLAAIRNYLRTLPSAALLVESINNEFLNTIDRAASTRVLRLALNIDDNIFFDQLMKEGNSAQLKPTRNSHHLLLSAAGVAKEWVENWVKIAQADPHGRLNDWLEYLEHNATVVLLKTRNGAQAFKMFETLNDRGLKTSQADLVKSYLFGESGGRISEAQTRWSSMRDNLEEIEEDEDRAINFLRHAYIATRDFVRAEDVYDATNKTVRGESASLAFLADLERLSRIYVATYRPDSAHWKGHPEVTLKALRIFNRFDIGPMRPLVLAIALKFGPRQSAAAMALMVSISVRLIIASATRSGVNEQAFAAAALGIFKETIKTAAALREALAHVRVSDADFKEAFLTARASKAELARYYLRALESSHAGESEPWHVLNEDKSQITLEHILPKNPMKGTWPEFDTENARRYLKRLGNLCLLQGSVNSSFETNSFVEKKKVYAGCPLEFTRQVAKFDRWSPQSVEARQKAMADEAVRAWPI